LRQTGLPINYSAARRTADGDDIVILLTHSTYSPAMFSISTGCDGYAHDAAEAAAAARRDVPHRRRRGRWLASRLLRRSRAGTDTVSPSYVCLPDATWRRLACAVRVSVCPVVRACARACDSGSLCTYLSSRMHLFMSPACVAPITDGRRDGQTCSAALDNCAYWCSAASAAGSFDMESHALTAT